MQGGEADAIRVRTLRGGWRWALAGAAALTIFLCVNQQFVLRFFVGFTPLNTEYYYALVLVMLPFVFVLFPGSRRSAVDRVPWVDAGLFMLTILVSLVLLINIRKAAELGWEYTGAPTHIVWAGYFLWALLMEGLRRTGGWGLMLSVLPFSLYPVFAESSWLGPLRGAESTLAQASAYHALSIESVLGIPLQAFAEVVIGFLVFGTALVMTGAGKFFINLAFALCGTFRGGAAKVAVVSSALNGVVSGSSVSNASSSRARWGAYPCRTASTRSSRATLTECSFPSMFRCQKSRNTMFHAAHGPTMSRLRWMAPSGIRHRMSGRWASWTRNWARPSSRRRTRSSPASWTTISRWWSGRPVPAPRPT